jgi:quercetin dioxygenase-like cupin family protein
LAVVLSWDLSYPVLGGFELTEKHGTTRRELLQHAAIAVGAASLITGSVHGQAQTNESRIVSAEEGSVWQMENGDKRPMTFKLLTEQTAGSISIFEETVPVGAGTPLHIHHTSDEVIHLLAGELTIKLGIHRSTIHVGTWVFIPRGTTHGWRNRGKVAAQASYVFTPSNGATCFEGMRTLGPMQSIPQETKDVLFKRAGFKLAAVDWE